MRNLWKAWRDNMARKRVIPAQPIAIEHLELRQMLSATSGVENIAAAEMVVENGRAVPRVDGVAGSYDFFDGLGTMTVVQNGLDITATISRPTDEPNGTFDASFKKTTSKVAKGFGQFTFEGDEEPKNVKVKIKFKPNDDGSFNFTYRYKIFRGVIPT